METFSALLAICAGNSPVYGEFPAQRPVTRGFDVFFDLRLNKRLSKQSWGWWLETLSCSLWRQSNVIWTMKWVSNYIPIRRWRVITHPIFLSKTGHGNPHMMTSSNGNICRVIGPLCGQFTGHWWIPRPHKNQWRGALMFSFICAWTNDWINNHEAS